MRLKILNPRILHINTGRKVVAEVTNKDGFIIFLFTQPNDIEDESLICFSLIEYDSDYQTSMKNNNEILVYSGTIHHGTKFVDGITYRKSIDDTIKETLMGFVYETLLSSKRFAHSIDKITYASRIFDNDTDEYQYIVKKWDQHACEGHKWNDLVKEGDVIIHSSIMLPIILKSTLLARMYARYLRLEIDKIHILPLRIGVTFKKIKHN